MRMGDKSQTEKPQPSIESRKVASGEYNHLLERYKIIAEKLKLDNPPLLKVLPSKHVGPGALSTDKEVIVYQPTLGLLSAPEQEFMLAHELGHEKDRREGKQFRDANECEKSADIRALEATNDPEAGIRKFRKIAAAHEIEYNEEIVAKLPPEYRGKAMQTLKRDNEEALNSRIQGIKDAISNKSKAR